MNTGIGFAVPINLAKDVSSKLISEGKFTRAWLGINIAGLSDTPDFRDTIKGVKEGVVVVNILPEGPAAKSDLEPGDVIVSVDSKTVKTPTELKNEIRTKKVGSDVNLDVVRDGKKMKLVVQPGDYAPEDLPVARRGAKAPEPEVNALGVKVEALTPALAKQFGVEASSGVIVTGVDSGSLAEEFGVQPGDVISKVDGKGVTNLREFRDAMKTADTKKGVRLNIQSEAGRRFTILKEDGE
jgi:serine protease Do